MSKNSDDILLSMRGLYSLHYLTQKDIRGKFEAGNKISLENFENKNYNSVSQILDEVIDRIRAVIPECDILFVDFTREPIGIPAVRVIITGDIQRLNVPMLAVSDRMYQFQKKMGYSDHEPVYEELFMGPYPH